MLRRVCRSSAVQHQRFAAGMRLPLFGAASSLFTATRALSMAPPAAADASRLIHQTRSSFLAPANNNEAAREALRSLLWEMQAAEYHAQARAARSPALEQQLRDEGKSDKGSSYDTISTNYRNGSGYGPRFSECNSNKSCNGNGNTKPSSYGAQVRSSRRGRKNRVGSNEPALYARDGVPEPALYARDGVPEPALYARDGVPEPALYARDGVPEPALYARDGVPEPYMLNVKEPALYEPSTTTTTNQGILVEPVAVKSKPRQPLGDRIFCGVMMFGLALLFMSPVAALPSVWATATWYKNEVCNPERNNNAGSPWPSQRKKANTAAAPSTTAAADEASAGEAAQPDAQQRVHMRVIAALNRQWAQRQQYWASVKAFLCELPRVVLLGFLWVCAALQVVAMTSRNVDHLRAVAAAIATAVASRV